MSERAFIEERLRKKEAEMQSLDERVRSARIYVQALRDVLRDLDGPSESAPKAGTMITLARDAIREAGRPLHVGELLKAIGRADDSKNSLTGSLAAYVRKKEIFTRPAPNTFGLIELGHTDETQEEEEAFVPPANFGTSKKPAFDDLDDDSPF